MRHPLRLAVAFAAPALVLGTLSGVPAASASSTTATSVTVLLSAPHPTALRHLADQRHLTRGQRRTRLSRLLPTATTRARVAARLRADGFTVTTENTWAVTATAPARTVAATLGTTTASGGLSNRDALGAGVSSVVTAATEPDLHPLTATTGATYRNAYAGVGGGASSGANDAASTVATIQLSGWNSADLTYYANHVLGAADPVASGQYTQVAVDGGNTDTSGSSEVDLDQEALLATAPSARQRAYIAPNSLAGFADAYAAVAADAASHGITAVSVSWGDCETDGWTSDEISTMENVLTSVNAAGVTVFGASGDEGIYDCGTSTSGVDYPASSTHVVAVGGTALSSTGGSSTGNTGSNWTESGWSCSSLSTCTRNGGSGGGASSEFSRPVWQTNTLSGTFAGGSTRLVPDVSAVGDPSTGFTAYTRTGSSDTYGGTSLATPVAAASFANALGDAGVTNHVGDIHEALYAAYQQARSSVFRDVTTGQNGSSSNRGSDPSVSAATGYDTVSGLGAVYWSALVPYLGSTTVMPTTGAGGSSVTGGTPSGGSSPITRGGGTTSAAGPGARASLALGRVAHHRRKVWAGWSTVRSTTTWSTTTVVVEDLTTGRLLWHGSGYSGRRAVRVRVGHVVRVVVRPRDTHGHGTDATIERRVVKR